MSKGLDWVHHDSKTFDEEQFMENIERKHIEKQTSHIEGFTKNYVDKLLEEKDKEIERLKEVIQKNDKDIDNLCKNQKKEIQRLNNIIDEIESLLKGRIECVPETMAEVYEDELILEKLQKLKEGKKCLKRKKKN